MKTRIMKYMVALLCASALMLGFSTTANAGPVIIGGDDLQDHGFVSGGVNMEGWKYIELAIADLFANQTRAADSGMATTVDIAALGSAPSAATVSDAGAAIGSAAALVAGGPLSVSYHDETAGGVASTITQFFTDLAAGTINPAIIWLAGTGAGNDQSASDTAAINANAAALNTFVANGGGLMSHGTGSNLGWLTTLLPGINVISGCQSSGAMLTAAGSAAFPGLTNADVDSNAGPCHSHFTGNFGGLVSLVNDGQGRPYIIGGGGGTVIQCGLPGQPPCPTVAVPATLPLLGLGLVGLAAIRRRRTA